MIVDRKDHVQYLTLLSNPFFLYPNVIRFVVALHKTNEICQEWL